jgi:hypothetical protein
MSRLLKIVLLAAAASVILNAVAYVFRDALATRVFAFVVDGLDSVQCDHAAVRVSRDLHEIRIAPLDCTIEEKPMHRLRTLDDAVITLDSVGIEDVRIRRVIVDYKERDISQVRSNTLGELAAFAGLSDKLVKSLLDASESFSTSAPPIKADVLTLNRGGEKAATMHDFVKSNDGVWERTYAARLESGPVELHAFDMRVTASSGRLAANLYVGKGEPGEKPDVPLLLEGAELDTKAPRVTLHVR